MSETILNFGQNFNWHYDRELYIYKFYSLTYYFELHIMSLK